jgi:hypothetical protein
LEFLHCLCWLLPGNGTQRRRFLSFPIPWLRSSLAGASFLTELGVIWLQLSNKGYSSHRSRTAVSKTVRPTWPLPRPRTFFLRLADLLGCGQCILSCIGSYAFSSREAVSPIKVIIWKKASHDVWDVCLRGESHLYVSLAAVY